MTSGQIARELGVTRQHVEWRLRRLKIPGLPHTVHDRKNSRWNDEALRERVRELHALGLVISEIGRRLNVSKNTIIGFCYRAGLTRRRKDRVHQPTSNPFPDPGICLWPGPLHAGLSTEEFAATDVFFPCPERQYKYLDRTGQPVSSPYCEEHHRRAHWDVKLKDPTAPQENNVVKIA